MSHVQGLVEAKLDKWGQDVGDHIFGVEGRDGSQRLGSEVPDRGLPVAKFDESQMLSDRGEIFWELGNEAGDVQIGIYSVRQSKVICFSKDLNTMREGSLATDTLLEGGTSSTTAVNFSIEK